jgi:hypothetical protein
MGSMKRLLIGLFLAGCGAGAPGMVDIGPEPEPEAPVEAVEPAPPARAAPVLTEAPQPEPEVIAAPSVPDEPPPPAGFHEAAGGACYLPDVLPKGSCRCAEYDAAGKLIREADNLCFDSCKYNEQGIAEMHAFCVDGGLATDMRPR